MALHKKVLAFELKEGVKLIRPFDELPFNPFPDPKRGPFRGTGFNRQGLEREERGRIDFDQGNPMCGRAGSIPLSIDDIVSDPTLIESRPWEGEAAGQFHTHRILPLSSQRFGH